MSPGNGEVDGELGGGMVAPRADGVEIGDEVCGKFRGEASRLSFCGKPLVRAWNIERPTRMLDAGCPRSGLIAEDAELDGQVRALGFDRRVDALRVELKLVELVRGQGGEGAVGGSTDLQRALDAVLLDQCRGRGPRPVHRRHGGAGCPSARAGPAR